MCGRYYVDDDTVEEIHRITKNADFPVRTGDIRPSETVVVLNQRSGKLAVENMVWGYSGYQGKNLLINARSEGWLFDEDSMKAALQKIPQLLNRRTEYEQLSFFFNEG